jgi:uncharacterized membrane protein YfcA
MAAWACSRTGKRYCASASPGAESFVGAAAGGALAGSASAVGLKLLLGSILIAAALKAFWKRL